MIENVSCTYKEACNVSHGALCRKGGGYLVIIIRQLAILFIYHFGQADLHLCLEKYIFCTYIVEDYQMFTYLLTNVYIPAYKCLHT